MDCNIFEISQDKLKHWFYSKPKKDVILPKRFKRGSEAGMRSRAFEFPTAAQKYFLEDHTIISLLGMLPYITILYWGVKRLRFLVWQKFKSYLYALKLALDFNIFFLLPNLIFFPLNPLVGLVFLFFWRATYCQLSGKCFRQT